MYTKPSSNQARGFFVFEFMEKRAEKRAMCEKVDILSIKKEATSWSTS